MISLAASLLLAILPARGDVTELVARAADEDLSRSERMAAFEQTVERGYGDGLIDLATDGQADARQRWVAIRALGRIKSPPASKALMGLLEDEMSGMRAAAASALGDTGGGQATEQIAGLLEDPAVIVRAAAADALAQLGDARAVPYLARALDDPSNHYRGKSLWVRRHFVDALGAIGDRSALPALVRGLEDSDEEVTQASFQALERVTGLSWADGRSQQEQRMAWQRWWAAQE